MFLIPYYGVFNLEFSIFNYGTEGVHLFQELFHRIQFNRRKAIFEKIHHLPFAFHGVQHDGRVTVRPQAVEFAEAFDRRRASIFPRLGDSKSQGATLTHFHETVRRLRRQCIRFDFFDGFDGFGNHNRHRLRRLLARAPHQQSAST